MQEPIELKNGLSVLCFTKKDKSLVNDYSDIIYDLNKKLKDHHINLDKNSVYSVNEKEKDKKQISKKEFIEYYFFGDNVTVCLLFVKKKVIGFVGYHIIDYNQHCSIDDVYIEVDYQHKGYFRQIHDYIVNVESITRKIKHFEILALSNNKHSLAIYEHLGYKLVRTNYNIDINKIELNLDVHLSLLIIPQKEIKPYEKILLPNYREVNYEKDLSFDKGLDFSKYAEHFIVQNKDKIVSSGNIGFGWIWPQFIALDYFYVSPIYIGYFENIVSLCANWILNNKKDKRWLEVDTYVEDKQNDYKGKILIKMGFVPQNYLLYLDK